MRASTNSEGHLWVPTQGHEAVQSRGVGCSDVISQIKNTIKNFLPVHSGQLYFYHTTNYCSNTLAAPRKRFFLISDDYVILWLPTYHLGRVFFSFFLSFAKKRQVHAMQVKCITNALFYSYTNSDMSCNNTRTTPG